MDIANNPKEVLSGNDNIVIVDNFQSIRGGRTLDVSAFTEDVIPAGTIVIQDDATKAYKPAPIAEGAYEALPEAHTIVGIVIAVFRPIEPLRAFWFEEQ